MTSVALSRIGTFSSTATTYVCLAATNKLKTKPMISLPEDEHHHHGDHMSLPNSFTPISASSLSKSLIGGKLRVSSAFSRSASVRFAHTDIKVPDFSEYRTELTENPNVSSKSTADERQNFHYISTFGIGLLTAYGAKAIVRDLVSYISPAADVLALAKIEVNLNEIPEGKNVTVKWRSKPLFVRHRTPEEIEAERQVDLSSLRDPQSDDTRCKNPEFLVVLGICTHLGCVPLANAGEFNGYFCPCHGSHYDSSGRIRKGPAPLNLEIPPYTINGDLLVVG